MEPWVFGERALPGQERLAAEVRALCSAALSLEEAGPALDEAVRALATARRALERLVPPGPGPRVGGLADGGGRVYLDHGTDIGSYNPMFPVYEIGVAGPELATGTVRFPVCYEGPPGCVHGGFLAVFADCVVQHHNCAVGETGKTRGIELRYRRPVPLVTDLDFTVERTAEEGSVVSAVCLTSGGEPLLLATASAVRADRDRLPAVSPRR